jgi:CRISPR type III-A-associated RAMP protein Csm4
MNPGLFVKLRPSGPWRIGPDSGARNRVDVIYHSDSLYSAVTSAMARMGSLAEWLDATARASASSVCFSSCFPFLDEIGFVVPPRTMWPPTSPALMSAAVRWKSARFVPLGVVQAMLAGQPLNKHHWSVDGASGCLIPVGRTGPFRTSVRWSAAVDRLSGASDRHATACIEFRPGGGLWTIVSFADEAARDRWQDPVKAAFRLLADTGFGGERSRGWGRAESPEFVEGMLPEMIVGAQETGARGQGPGAGGEEPAVEAAVVAPREVEALVVESDLSPVPPIEEPPPEDPEEREPDPEPDEPAPIPPFEESASAGMSTADPFPPTPDPIPEPEPEPPIPSPIPHEPEPLEAVATPEAVETVEAPTPDPRPLTPEVEPPPVEEPESLAPGPWPLAPASEPPAPGLQAHWLLSLFSPAPADAVDWARGNYTVLARGGRVDSPAGSGELKKQVRMVAEGSVVYSGSALSGAAADVAPDGFAHPVFRAGFALAIPLPEVR